MRGGLWLIPLALALSACSRPPISVTPSPVPVGPDPKVVSRVISRAAEQIRTCYRSPKLNRAARQIVTVLRVRYTTEGFLATKPVLIRQSGGTEDNMIFAGQMTRAAMAAVERCAPLRLPSELYKGGWDEFDLTFSPRGLA